MKFTPEQLIQFQHIIETYIIANNSSGEVILSPGESVLMLIDACKKAKESDLIINALKAMYLEGVKSEDDLAFFRFLREELADKKQFKVSTSPDMINKDPSRRYFESHLMLQTLHAKAHTLNLEALQAFTQKLKDNLWNKASLDRATKKKIERILSGDMHKSLNKYELEYAELIKKLKQHTFHGLSPKACECLCEIAKSTILATLNTQHDQSMPADVYKDSIFSMGMDGRGREIKRQNSKVRSTAKGIMRSTTPLPYYDVIRDDTVSPFERSADQANFMIESSWSQHLFARQTHVYSNGISSTTLAHLRCMLMQKRFGNAYHDEHFQAYMTTFAALMLYNSGGHSLFEIFEVFKLPQFEELMKATGCNELLARDKLMDVWLREDQANTFDSSLDEAIRYQQTLLFRRILNAEHHHWATHVATLSDKTSKELVDMRGRLSLKAEYTSDEHDDLTLHQAVTKLDPSSFQLIVQETLSHNPHFNLDTKNSGGYTALMIAAQLGKLEHVKSLIDLGASTTSSLPQKGTRVRLTALELAIKSERAPVVDYLLHHTNLISHNRGDHRPNRASWQHQDLKTGSPALYFACRQTDVRILKAVTDKIKPFTLKDKLLAVCETIHYENIDGLNALTSSLSSIEIAQITTKNKQIILNLAAGRGNLELLSTVLNSQLISSPHDIDYNTILKTATDRDYLPIARLILSHHFEQDGGALTQAILDQMLMRALENEQYDMAILAIIYGANPDIISFLDSHLAKFTQYLQTTPPEYYDAFFSEQDKLRILSRAEELQRNYQTNKTSWFHRFIDALVSFLNLLPFVNLGGYYQKQEVIARITYQVVTPEPKTDVELDYVRSYTSYDNPYQSDASTYHAASGSLFTSFNFFSWPRAQNEIGDGRTTEIIDAFQCQEDKKDPNYCDYEDVEYTVTAKK